MSSTVHERHAALLRKAASGDMDAMYQAMRVEAPHVDWSEVEPLLMQADPNGKAPPDDEIPTFATLRELQKRPELLESPERVVPHGLAYRGRTTLLASGDKTGKTTILAHAASKLSRGAYFLGERLTVGSVIWCGLEEALGDAVKRFTDLNADPDRLHLLLIQKEPALLARINELMNAIPAPWAIVDSLAEYARVTLGQAPDDGDAAGWGAVVRPLTALAHERDCALTIIHHARRSDGQYRSSGEIAAAVDCLWEMRPGNTGEDPTLRRFTGRARWSTPDFAVRMVDGAYQLGGGGELSLDARILADLGANPGTSRTAQHGRIGGRKQSYLAEVGKLINGDAIVEQRGGLYLPHDVSEVAL